MSAHKAHMVMHPERGRYALTKRDEAALKALGVEYYHIQFDDGARLLFLGLADLRDTTASAGFELSVKGNRVLHNINKNVQETDVS